MMCITVHTQYNETGICNTIGMAFNTGLHDANYNAKNPAQNPISETCRCRLPNEYAPQYTRLEIIHKGDHVGSRY